MSKIETFANELAVINSNLIVTNTKEEDKLALVISSTDKEYSCLVSFNNFHYCIIVDTTEENIKSNLRLAASSSGFEVFERPRQ